MNRITLAGAALSFTVVALAGGVAVSAVQSRHHKDAAVTTATPEGRTDAQRQAVAQQLRSMQPVAGIYPTSRCLEAATVYDACFNTATRIPTVTSPWFARFLADLGVAATSQKCSPVRGGVNGDGIACLALGTWSGSPVSVFAFSPQGAGPTGVTGTDLTVTAVSSLPG